MVTKNETNRLIDKLGGNETEECLCCKARCEEMGDKNCGHDLIKQIMLTDVLEKKKKPLFCISDTMSLKKIVTLVRLWGHCGFTRSFQEIVESSGWEEDCCGECDCGLNSGCKRCLGSGMFPYDRLQDPNARNLTEFLNNLFTKK